MTTPFLTDYDLHLLAEGTHYRTYEKLGAHVCTEGGVRGVHFAVWAPNARAVSVVGDFDGWDPAAHPMALHAEAGVWVAFVPGVVVGDAFGPRRRVAPHFGRVRVPAHVREACHQWQQAVGHQHVIQRLRRPVEHVGVAGVRWHGIHEVRQIGVEQIPGFDDGPIA